MPRPTTKQELIAKSVERFHCLWSLIDSIDDKNQNANFNFSENIGKEAHWKRDKNIRDVLTHLFEWHQLLLIWVNDNQSGKERPFLPAPYNWKTYGDMNSKFWEKHQHTSFDSSKEMLKESHDKVASLVGNFSDKDLFLKGRMSWVGSSTLGQYFTSVTASHYDWAIKKIKMHIKTL